jgi:hypothetical protein
MAFAMLSRPGTNAGPCEGHCEHKDCAVHRQAAAQVCPECLLPIGYDRPIMRGEIGTEGLWHVECLQKALDREAAKGGADS